MIKNFKDRATEEFWSSFGVKTNKLGSIANVAMRKLRMLNNADKLIDLRVPPGNRLEKLEGDRVGQYSIRINGQYRICFVWDEHDAIDVEIVDYH